MDTEAILQNAIDLAMEAGNVLLSHFERPIQQDNKSSDIDIVTQADTEAEALIVGRLQQAYPTHHIVGEEGGGSGAAPEDAPYFWYVDPVDGTTNYAGRIPHFCTSIALADRDRRPIIGVIYDPTRDDLYTAVRGKGTRLNGDIVRVTQTDSLRQSVLASGFPYDRATNPDNNLAQWSAFMPQVRGLRRFGSAALDLAYVAAGRFEGYWEGSLNLWDVMAGVLLVTEAGGTVTDYAGQPDPQQRDDLRVVASNGAVHQQMLDVLAGISA